MNLTQITILGCTVRAYDPTTRVERPDDSLYVDNLHYYNMGIAPEDGKGRIWKEDDSPRSEATVFPISLQNLLIYNFISKE